MRNRLSKTLAFILALAMIIAIMPISNISVRAAAYNGAAAAQYALAHVYDGVGECAEFVSNCLSAGGCGAWSKGVINLRSALINGGYGTEYQLATNGARVYASDNSGKISIGDPIFFKCSSCGWTHVMICSAIENNIVKASGHNAAEYNSEWVNGYSDQYGHHGTPYVFHMTSHTHSYGSWQVVTAATCTTAGSQKRVCSCGDTQTQTIPATGHSWDAGVVETSADCTSEGVKKYTCTKCNTTRTEAISATGHTPVIDKAVAATCTETGLTEGSHCSVCNAIITKQETVPALGHDYRLLTYKKGCESVTATYKCDRCSETKAETKSDYILSDWLEEKPENIDESLITEKTQYSYSDKSTTYMDGTSTHEGWTYTGNSEAIYGSWNNVGWTKSKPSETDTLRITDTKTVTDQAAHGYILYYYYYPGTSATFRYKDYGGSSGKETLEVSSLSSLTKSNEGPWYDDGTTYYGYWNGTGVTWFLDINNSSQYPQSAVTHTEWYYQTRTKTTRYYFEKWSDYSDWSDEEIEETENRQVKTRTVYQYKITANGHSFSSDWQTDSKSHWHVCTECGEAIDVAAHTYDNDKDTTCNECGYVRKIAVESETKITVDSKKAMTGKEFTVSVDLTKNPGMAYLKLEMDYDSDVFEFISAKNLNVLSGTYTTSKTTDVKPYVLQWMGAENSTENGNIAELTFKVKENAAVGDYTISINALEAYNEQFEDVEIETHDGIITVSNVLAGDFNGDDVINGKDGILCSQILAGWDVEYEELAADLNGDGVFNGKDGILLSQYLAGWDVVLG